MSGTESSKMDTSMIVPLGIPLSEAADDLYMREAEEMTRHFGKPLEEMGALELAQGVIRAHARRHTAGVGWDTVSWLRVRDIPSLFADEPELDDDEAEAMGEASEGPKGV